MRKIRRTGGTQQPAPQSVTVARTLNAKSIWALGIIGIMVFSAIGFYYADRQDLAPGYKGYGFKLGPNNEYLLKWEGQRIPFTYHPQELEHISVDALGLTALRGAIQVLITFDANSSDPVAMDTVRFRLGERMEMLGIAVGMGVQQASALYPLPVLGCANATPYIPVLELRLGEATAVSRTESCITLSAPTGRDLETAGERLEYSLLGVMG